jgi:hypothetical protein
MGRKSEIASPVARSSDSLPLLVTVAVAAELLSVSTWEVRRLCRKGLLAYKKLSPTKWLVTVRSIRQFADVCTNGRAA